MRELKRTQEPQSPPARRRTPAHHGGRCSRKSCALTVLGAELQPHATLDRSRSFFLSRTLFCLQTICSAPRHAGSSEGAQMDGFFDNSLKQSTQAQQHHMPKGRPARRAVARPSLLGSAAQAACPARTPARSLTCRELASISRGRFVSAEGRAARRRFKLLGRFQPAHRVLISHGLGGTRYRAAPQPSETQ